VQALSATVILYDYQLTIC